VVLLWPNSICEKCVKLVPGKLRKIRDDAMWPDQTRVEFRDLTMEGARALLRRFALHQDPDPTENESERLWPLVSRIELFMKAPILRRVTLVDLPGIEGHDPTMTERVEKGKAACHTLCLCNEKKNFASSATYNQVLENS